MAKQPPKKATQQPAKKGQPANKVPQSSHPASLFRKENYLIMLAGLVIFIIGLILMAGGGSKNPNEFYPDKIYSFRRITLAPIVIIIGLLVEIFAIMRKPKEASNEKS